MQKFRFKKLILSPAGILFILCVLNFQFASAQFSFSTQKEKVETRNGNKEYQNEKFPDAEASYKKALDIKNNMEEATFNLGDAIYEQKRYEDAGKQFQLSAQINSDEKIKAKAYHNLGNSFMQQKKYEDAIKAYKNALKINPKDADTKYNLAYANEMLQKNKGGGGQDNKDQKDKKDQKDSKDDKQQNKDSKDQKKDEKQDQQQQKDQEQKDKQQQGQKPKLTKEEADKLLKALQNEEQKTNQKMQQKQLKGVRVKVKKDW